MEPLEEAVEATIRLAQACREPAGSGGAASRRWWPLQEAINRFVEEHNRDPRPFVWTADPDAIVEKVRRGYHALASMERPAA